MVGEKKPVHKVEMTEGKRQIITNLPPRKMMGIDSCGRFFANAVNLFDLGNVCIT